MAQANDSITVTPGSGATVATHLASGKEHQVVVLADSAGHLQGTLPTWVLATGLQANVNAARTTHVDLYNATGSGVLLVVHGIFLVPSLAAVTGVGLTWEVIRTTTVGTGGTTLTPRPMDTTNAALPAQVTARSKPTGGATTNYVLLYPSSSSEETSPYAGQASTLNHLGIIGDDWLQELVIREGEGLKVDQTTSSSVGSTNVVLVFTVE